MTRFEVQAQAARAERNARNAKTRAALGNTALEDLALKLEDARHAALRAARLARKGN